MGDLNTEGREYLHQKLLKMAPIDDYIGDSPTFKIANTERTRSLDGVFARNLPQAQISLDFQPWTDHAFIQLTLPFLIAETPDYIFSKKIVQQQWTDNHKVV